MSAKNFAAAFLALSLFAGVAAAESTGADPISSPLPYIAMLDSDTGQVLYCRECEKPMPPSSMSKIMTVMVVEDAIKAGKIKPDTEFLVSQKAWEHGAKSDGSHMFLEINSRVKVDDLIKGAVIVSANDACIALAEGVAGSEDAFVALENKKAKDLGLTSAHFANSTGLPDPNHYISAVDLARLARSLIRDYPDTYKLYSTPSLTYNNHTQENRNPLLGHMDGADGVKTGHTEIAGYGLIGSAVANGQRRIVVFNGANSMKQRAEEAQKLMRSALYDFSVSKLYAKGAEVADADVWLGGKKKVSLVTTAPVTIVAHQSVKADLSAHVEYEGPLPAPIKKGEVIAKLVVEGGGVRQEFPLAAGDRVGKANPVSRAFFGFGKMLGGG